jgi:NurA domain
MAYASLRGRKPAEHASKISHTEIIANPAVQALLAQCAIPKPAAPSVIAELAQAAPTPDVAGVEHVVAVDGGYRETSVRDEYPSAAVTFFTFGPLRFALDDLRALDDKPFLAPEDMATLKHIQRFTLALPTRNISRNGMSLERSVRETLQDFFESTDHDDAPLADTLRWLLFRGWSLSPEPWVLPNCPNPGCDAGPIELTHKTPNRSSCESCSRPVFLVDALRLHERVDEEHGAGGISGYVMTALEQLVLVHIVKALYELKPDFLRRIVFIKDGPLAFFGPTAPLSKPMRAMAEHLGGRLLMVGLEKSGAFVEHADQIADRMDPGSVLVLTNDYIYRYVVPGDPANLDPYGKNTYWGGKLIYKAADENMYVATVPTGAFTPNAGLSDFTNLPEVLSVLGLLRCSMYDNALIPIALANKLVSLSEFPSSRILETFAKSSLG